jgi:DNA-binding LacI/PurR family transcriptional regulator
MMHTLSNRRLPGPASPMKRQPRVTSHEVAALAGVSRSAVSRTFTPGASVSRKTREKVLAAATQLGYRPNALARSLIVRSTHMIGLVMAEWENPFYTRMLRQFSERFQAEGYQLLLMTSNSEADVDDAVRRLMQYQVDGLVVVSAKPSDALAEECENSGTPLVLLNRHSPGERSSSVTCDNAQVGREMVRLLIAAGYRRLAIVRGDPRVLTGMERTAAIHAAVAATPDARGRGRPVTGVLGYAAGRKAMAELWQSPEPPDAAICSSDPTALGMLDGARRDLGIAVPEQFAVIGLGDIPQASWAAYGLTTVHLPVDEMIDLAVQDLLARLSDPDRPPRPMVAHARLVTRGSVRAVMH